MTKTKPRSDQDSPWKVILRTYFPEVMKFFFSDVAALIDWDRPYEFRDKEFQQIAPDAAIGKRYADLLVQAYRKDGPELWLFLHLEVQGRRETNFTERVFVYNTCIFHLFRKPAISLVILCDDSPTWRPDTYEFSFPGTELFFRFGIVKVLDYRQSWADLEQDESILATVVMTHLKAQETQRSPSDRKAWKLSLMRRLYERGHKRQDIINLFRFIDWMMGLPKRLQEAFWQELQTYEEQRRMSYITSVERIGFKRGRAEGEQIGFQRGEQAGFQRGEQIGFQQGERSLILKQITRRIGAISPEAQAQIEVLSLLELEALGEALLDFSQPTDLQTWLRQQDSDRQI